MPHIVVKLYAGRTEEQKRRLADALTAAITGTLGSSEETVSVAIEDVAPERWMEDVYQPEIVGKRDVLYRKPGYGPGV